MASGGEGDYSQFCSKEEKDKLVAEVIRYVLFKTHENSGCPIKREELTQIVTRHNYSRALPALVINEAREKLSGIFGYELKELQRSRSSSTSQARSSQQTGGADARSYILVSQLPSAVYKKYVEDVTKAHLTGLSFAVISIVHLSGGKIAEENLWCHLKKLGLHDNDVKHPDFGNMKQALEALVQQRFLQKGKVVGPEASTMVYELAERALDASISGKIKEYIAQIVKRDVPPEEGE